MRLSAKQVQEMIGVPDGEIICHGYTFDRKTLDVWFENDQLVRRMYEHDRRQEMVILDRWESEEFDPSFFRENVKRWYENSVHPKLAMLFDTFGEPMNTTPGGTARMTV